MTKNTSHISKLYSIKYLILSTISAFSLGLITSKAIDTAQAILYEQKNTANITVANKELDNPSKATDITPKVSANELIQANKIFKTTDWSAEQPEGIKELLAAMPHSLELRKKALQRYREEREGKIKTNLRQLLMAQSLPDVITSAVNWVKQTDDAMARTDGYKLLNRAAEHPEVHAVIKQGILNESNSFALAAAIWALSSPNVVDPAEVQTLVPRLHTLTQHANDDIRAASIQRLADWDRSKKYLTQDVQRLLSDSVEDVRIAAIGATSIASMTNDTLKHQLFIMLNDIKQTEELRSIVHMQLSRFGLSTVEYAAYQAAQKILFKEDKPK